jgi:Ca2+-transporting ATPase
MDPLKPSIIESIQAFKKAGINVIMCTGDNLETAKAIGIASGILPSENSS